MDKIKHLENKYSVARYDLIRECDGDELRFYLYLKLYAINKHEAFPTYKTLQQELGWDRSRISRLIKKMIKKDRLRIGKKKGKTAGGKQSVNIYDITWYDNVNNKGKNSKGSSVLNKGGSESQLPFQDKGSSVSRLELLRTNNNITNRVLNNFKNDDERTIDSAGLKKFQIIKSKYPIKSL